MQLVPRYQRPRAPLCPPPHEDAAGKRSVTQEASPQTATLPLPDLGLPAPTTVTKKCVL